LRPCLHLLQSLRDELKAACVVASYAQSLRVCGPGRSAAALSITRCDRCCGCGRSAALCGALCHALQVLQHLAEGLLHLSFCSLEGLHCGWQGLLLRVRYSHSYNVIYPGCMGAEPCRNVGALMELFLREVDSATGHAYLKPLDQGTYCCLLLAERVLALLPGRRGCRGSSGHGYSRRYLLL
jgi:hypothetical protein